MPFDDCDEIGSEFESNAQETIIVFRTEILGMQLP